MDSTVNLIKPTRIILQPKSCL